MNIILLTFIEAQICRHIYVRTMFEQKIFEQNADSNNQQTELPPILIINVLVL